MRSLAPGLRKVNDPTVSCCSRLGAGGGGAEEQPEHMALGSPNSSLPTPPRRGTRRRLQAFVPELLGAPMAGHRPHPNLDPGPETLAPPLSSALPPHWPLQKAQAQRNKSRLTA